MSNNTKKKTKVFFLECGFEFVAWFPRFEFMGDNM